MAWLIALALLGLAAVLAGEVLVRVLGFSQFPLYAPDTAAGYRMKANQAGTFRRHARWVYDGNGMRSQAGADNLAGAVLLIGDSIVDGGSALDQDETIASQLAALSGRQVYPIAAPGWSLGNALGALPTIAGWEQAEAVVLVLNAGDFDYRAEASSEFGFPMRRARWMVPWLIRRQRFIHQANRRGVELGADEFPFNAALRAENLTRLRALFTQTRARRLVVRYPKRDVVGDPDTGALSARSLAASGKG